MSLSGRHRSVLCVAGLVAVGCLVSALGVLRAPSLSLLDEWTHLDYAWRVAHGEVPAAGDPASPFVLEERSCRLQENFGPEVLPPCGSGAPADAFPTSSDNYNTWHPPLYYAVTGLLARVLTALPFGLSFTTAARLTGGVWLASAMAALFGVLRMWATPRWVAVSGAALLAAAPSVAHASSIVTNDAPAPLAGAGALWVLTRVVVQARVGWLVPATVALLTAGTKVMSTVAILTVAGVLAVSAVLRRRQGERDRSGQEAVVGVAIVLAVAAVHVGWAVFQSPRTEDGWRSPVAGMSTEPVVGAPFGEWAPTLFSAYGIVDDYWLPAALDGALLTAWSAAFALLLTAAPLMALTALDGAGGRRLGAVALLGPAATVLLVQGQALLSTYEYFPYPTARYAMSLVPLTLACLVLVALRRRLEVPLVVVATTGLVATLLELTGVV